MKYFATAYLNEVIHNNAHELVIMLAHGANEGLGDAVGTDRLMEFIKNIEIISALWSAATSRRIQFRGQRKVREIRKIFADIAGSDQHLPWPEWLPTEVA